MRKLVSTILVAVLLSSCSYAFKDKIRKSAELGIPFSSARANIDRDTGSVFIWGGVIVNSVISGSDNFIEVSQTPLDKYGKVIDPHVSEGRFLVYSPSRLSAEEYQTGRLISVAGFLTKGIKANLEGSPYTYPLLESIQIRLWDYMEGGVPKAYFPYVKGKTILWADPAN